MQTDRYTDMTKLIVAFLNFGNTPKNWKAIQVVWKLGDILKILPFELSNLNFPLIYAVLPIELLHLVTIHSSGAD